MKEILINSTSSTLDSDLIELLPYAPKPMVDKIKNSLVEIKKITNNFID